MNASICPTSYFFRVDFNITFFPLDEIHGLGLAASKNAG
jgi:hypothetical protein